MSDSKVLVIDADEQRAETLAAILRFIDYTPVLVSSLTQFSLEGRSPHDWLAVIVGQEDDWPALERFATWLKRDRYHPPLLVLAKYHNWVICSNAPLHCMPSRKNRRFVSLPRRRGPPAIPP